eukprot:6283996-Amphidinium_carterae.1
MCIPVIAIQHVCKEWWGRVNRLRNGNACPVKGDALPTVNLGDLVTVSSVSAGGFHTCAVVSGPPT